MVLKDEGSTLRNDASHLVEQRRCYDTNHMCIQCRVTIKM